MADIEDLDSLVTTVNSRLGKHTRSTSGHFRASYDNFTDIQKQDYAAEHLVGRLVPERVSYSSGST